MSETASHEGAATPAPTAATLESLKGVKKKKIVAVVIVAALGALAFGFDTGVISGAIPFLELPFSKGGLALSPKQVGIVTSSLLIGAAFGGVLAGNLADAKGRRPTIVVLSLLFIAGAVGTSQVPTMGVMVCFRIVLGLAVGGASAIVPVFIGELAPTRIRGNLVAVNELLIVTGQLLAYTTNAIIANVLPNHPDNWRWMLLVCTLPAAGLFFGTLYLTESPRWLVAHHRPDEALKVLYQLRGEDDDIVGELNDIDTHIAQLRKEEGAGTLWQQLQVPWIRRITLIGIGLAFLSQMTGVNSVMYYAPTILIDTGLGTNAALVATIANGVVAVAAVAFGSAVLLPRLSRRRMLLTGQIGVTICHVLMGTAFLVLPAGPARAYVVLAFMLCFLFCMQGFVAVIFWLVLSEIFPVRVRGKVMGIAVFANWTANFIVALVFPQMQAALGGATFFVFAVINFGTIFFYLKFIPETKGKSLEELEQAFAEGHR